MGVLFFRPILSIDIRNNRIYELFFGSIVQYFMSTKKWVILI